MNEEYKERIHEIIDRIKSTDLLARILKYVRQIYQRETHSDN